MGPSKEPLSKAGTEDKVEEANDQIDESVLATMSEQQRRLFQLRMRINQSRKVNKVAVEEEFRRLDDPKYALRERFRTQQELGNQDPDLFLQLHTATDRKQRYGGKNDLSLLTAESAEQYRSKLEQKEKNLATFGMQALCSDSTYKAYNKILDKLPKADDEHRALEPTDALSYGKSGNVSQTGLDRLSRHIEEHQEARRKFSRRRASMEASNVDCINDKNEAFNKKIKRSFDKYTVEIRQNLERGTAI
jgi:hypothetical protein